jgi:hypothetical protein
MHFHTRELLFCKEPQCNYNKPILCGILEKDSSCFLCNHEASWIPSNLRGVQTIQQDQYGFWLINYARKLPKHSQPYVFPPTNFQVK